MKKKTYRDFLKRCDNLEFAAVVLCKAAELEGKYCCQDMDDDEMRLAIENEFANWLDEEVM